MTSGATPPSPEHGGAAAAAPDSLTRFLAWLIDAVAAGIIGMVPLVGGIAGAAYILFRDGLDFDFMRHRSLGKRIMKLEVVRLDGAPMDLVTSARRNWPLAFGSLVQVLLFIPFLGWALIPFVGIAALVLVVIEIVKVFTAAQARRLGDEMAGTRVVASAS